MYRAYGIFVVVYSMLRYIAVVRLTKSDLVKTLNNQKKHFK